MTPEGYKFCQPRLETVVALPLEMQKVMFSTIFSSSFENTANFTNTPTFLEHAASYGNEECLTLQRVNSVQTRNKNLHVWDAEVQIFILPVPCACLHNASLG